MEPSQPERSSLPGALAHRPAEPGPGDFHQQSAERGGAVDGVLWGYNGVLVAIAIGGIFHAPTRRSLLLAVGGAALSTPISMLVRDALSGLPPLTLGFVITTWALILAARRSLPALMPVSLHVRRRSGAAGQC